MEIKTRASSLISLLALVFVLFQLSLSASAETKSAAEIYFFIIYPGGPAPDKEGEKLVSQFIETVAEMTELDPKILRGEYFNETSKAVKFIEKNRDAYIMGSLAFFLSQRRNLSITPLATVKLTDSPDEQYYIIVQKGKYTSLEQLKGKTLSGNALYEDHRFINALIFDGKLDVNAYFSLKPTLRPLSAIRKVAKDELDAVLLDQVQYHSLQRLPLSEKVSVIYKSPPLPPLGFMMIETSKTKKYKDKISSAIVKMCDSEKGKAACRNFGLNGFEPLKTGALDDVVKKYETGGK
ncbi:MAG: hypothetical protein Kow0090_03170 [Myxococcota bacterium]